MSQNSRMTITEFLEARIAEDERHACKLAETDRRPLLSIATTVNHPQRLLAECAAKRAILAKIPKSSDTFDPLGGTSAYVLRCLASVYADHPDYQQEWAL